MHLNTLTFHKNLTFLSAETTKTIFVKISFPSVLSEEGSFGSLVTLFCDLVKNCHQTVENNLWKLRNGDEMGKKQIYCLEVLKNVKANLTGPTKAWEKLWFYLLFQVAWILKKPVILIIWLKDLK